MSIALATAAITCAVVRVHDGDGSLWCSNGVKIRVAGIQAPDFRSTDPCRRDRAGYVCNDVDAERSKRVMQRLVLNRTLTCNPVGMSYKRVVARCTLPDGRSLSCAAIAVGAASRWDSYWRRYHMGGYR